MFEFFGLLHVASSVSKPVNLRSGRDPIDIYLYCASLCSKSFRFNGYKFRLITNNIAVIKERMLILGISDLDILEYDFSLSVPTSINFYSAHFKLELIDAFGRGIFGSHIALVDIDTVLLRDFDKRIFSSPGLVGYNMTSSEVLDYGSGSIKKALRDITGVDLEPCWWGGEFLLGQPKDFAILSNYIKDVWPNYISSWQASHHQGDEALISSAIAMMLKDGIMIADAGALNGVHRWWSARTLSSREGLATAISKSLIHLPSDKAFLARFADYKGFSSTRFKKEYVNNARRKIILRVLIGFAKGIMGEKPRKYAPRLK